MIGILIVWGAITLTCAAVALYYCGLVTAMRRRERTHMGAAKEGRGTMRRRGVWR